MMSSRIAGAHTVQQFDDHMANSFFSHQQTASLEDYIDTSIMLQMNKC